MTKMNFLWNLPVGQMRKKRAKATKLHIANFAQCKDKFLAFLRSQRGFFIIIENNPGRRAESSSEMSI